MNQLQGLDANAKFVYRSLMFFRRNCDVLTVLPDPPQSIFHASENYLAGFICDPGKMFPHPAVLKTKGWTISSIAIARASIIRSGRAAHYALASLRLNMLMAWGPLTPVLDVSAGNMFTLSPFHVTVHEMTKPQALEFPWAQKRWNSPGLKPPF